MKIVKCNKSELNKLISWSSSRYNERKKGMVIEDIIYRVEKGEDCEIEYRSGCYSEAAHIGTLKSKWTGGSYTLLISAGVSILINTVSDVVTQELEQIELIKPAKNKYFIHAKRILYENKEYDVEGQTIKEFIISEKITRIFKSRFGKEFCSETNYVEKEKCTIIV